MRAPTYLEAVAFSRHVVTFAMGGIAVGTAAHVLSTGDASSATGAITQISSGVASIVAGITTLVGIGSGIWAAISASPLRQLLAVAANPNVKQVVVKNAIADDTDHPKVVTQAEAAVKAR